MIQDILTYSYRNKPVHTAAHTDSMHLSEIIVYILGERLMMGLEGNFELDDRMLEYLKTCLDILDQPNVGVIYEEIKKRIQEISSDYIYQSLLLNGEFYLKYDYHLDKRFSRIQLYVDPKEAAWSQW